jgi:3-phosphoshikimate 1-carboxyvinyltransferase
MKETERITALKNEYEKLGIQAETLNTGNLISAIEIPASGRQLPSGVRINSYGDHRMAMTFAPLAIRSGSIFIDDPEAVTKSYPGFWNDLVSLGFEIV